MLNPRLDRAPLRRSSAVFVWLGMFTLTVATAGMSLRGGEAALDRGDSEPSLSSTARSAATPTSPRAGLSRPIASPAPQARDAKRPTATQTASAGISGTVRDQAGRAIPGVPVVVSDGASTVAETVTDQEGRFEVTSLAPGRYQVRISKPGFKTLLLEFVVRAGETGRLEGVLQLGMLSETVVVAAGTGSPAGASLAPRARHAGVAASDDPCEQSTAGGCVTPPRKLVDAKPVYPPVHAQAGVTGEVVIEGVLKPDGKLAELQPQPDADPDFAAAAIHALRLWEFSPTRLNGEPVDVQVRATVKFVK